MPIMHRADIGTDDRLYFVLFSAIFEMARRPGKLLIKIAGRIEGK